MENAAELSAQDTSSLVETERTLLDRAREVANTVLESRAEEIDRTQEFPFSNLDALAEAGLVAVTTPKDWGGIGASAAFMREYTEILTSACGTTWFILTQHLGSCGSIAGSQNPTLRERFLRDMAAGRHYVGVGFGHLRRPEPMLRAELVSGGWRLTGTAPWVTGWPALKGVIYGATLPDGRHLHAYSPTMEDETLQAGPPQALCAMGASATVAVTLNNHFIPEENFVRYGTREDMARGDTNGIAGVVHPPLGCATGSLRQLRKLAEKKATITAIAEAADRLDAEIIACRNEARRWAEHPKDDPEYKPNALKARAWAIELGVRAAHMTVTAASGAANDLHHPAQRRFREAMFYTLTAQTGDILVATLERLSQRESVA